MSAGFILAAAAAVILLAVVIIWAVISMRGQATAWKQVAGDLGAEYVPSGLFRPSKVVAHLGSDTLTLSTFSVPSGDSSVTYTRLRVPLRNQAGWQFTVFREGLVGKIDKALGMHDVEIGIAEFDDVFVVQSSDEAKVRALLSNTKVRQLIQAQPSFRLKLTQKNELDFEERGVISDVTRLKNLFALFEATLPQLER